MTRIKTDIIVLERSARIGGETFSFLLSCYFEDSRHPCIDLGTKKIYSIVDLILDRGRVSLIIKQMGLEISKIVKYDQNTFKLYDIDGSIIHGNMIEAAREFLVGVLANTTSSSIAEIEEQLLKHELYPLLHNTHIRILQWLLAQLEADIADTCENEHTGQQITIPGGSGQITHGLAYGLEGDDNPFRIMTKKEVTNLDFDSDASVVVSCVSKEYFETEVVIVAASEREFMVY
jgi:hypothetical protein